MNTIRIEKKECRLIAHRGVSGLETENTCAAFVAAGVKSYYGIETDVHVTSDGKYLICHDDNARRVSGVNAEIEKTDFETLRKIRLFDTDRKSLRGDLIFPSLEEYISVCRKYGKTAVLELKNRMTGEHIEGIYRTVKDMGWSNDTVFISFSSENLVFLRESHSETRLQFLTDRLNEKSFSFLKKYRMDADVNAGAATEEWVARLHAAGLKVNCWTVDSPETAARLISMGVDYITTDILE